MNTKFRYAALTLALSVALSAQAQEAGATGSQEADKKKDIVELNTVVATGTRQAGLSPTESI